jgi:hypothetical protein
MAFRNFGRRWLLPTVVITADMAPGAFPMHVSLDGTARAGSHVYAIAFNMRNRSEAVG